MITGRRGPAGPGASLLRLRLNGTPLDPMHAARLGLAIQRRAAAGAALPQLQELGLANCRLGNEGVEALVAGLLGT